MTNIVLSTTDTTIVPNSTVEVTPPVVDTLVKPSALLVEVNRREYSIVGDALYASITAGDAPSWLTSIIDSTVATGLNSGLQELQNANASLLAAIDEINIAENEYQQLINIDVTVDASVVSHLGTLNATVGQNSASILSLDVSKVTETEATAIALSQISAELGTTGGIGAEVTRIDSAIASLDQSYATSIETLTATYESANTEIAGLTQVTNSLVVDIDSIESKWAYNSVLNINGQYYSSGFGINTSGSTSGTGTEADPFTSEFWINAKEFVVRDGATEYIKWNGTVLEVTGDIVGANISGATVTGASVVGTDITGSTITGSTVTGGLIQTSGTGRRISLDSLDNKLKVFDGVIASPVMTLGDTLDDGEQYVATIDTTGAGMLIKSPNWGLNVICTGSSARTSINCGINNGFSGWSVSAAEFSAVSYGGSSYGIEALADGSGGSNYGGRFNSQSANVSSYGVWSSGNNFDFYAVGPGVNYGPFTGAHDGLVLIGSMFTVGDIVCDEVLVESKNISNTIFTSVLSTNKLQVAIGVVAGDESTRVPAALSNLVRDVSTDANGKESSTTNELGSLPTGFNVIPFNALGEGQLNVCGEGGDLFNGDLIVTSSTPGKGMKQEDNIVRNYTVAKVRGDWSFSSLTEIKQVPCIYLCG